MKGKPKAKANKTIVGKRYPAKAEVKEWKAACSNPRGRELADSPMLTFSFDECSSNLAMPWWVQYKRQMRVIQIRDIYHPELSTFP